jgi:hypothetical protein
MPKKIYKVELSEEEREMLTKIVKTGKSPAKAIMRSNILLSTADNRKPKVAIREVAEIFDVSPTTVNNIRKSYAEMGMDGTIKRKKRETPPIARKVTGDVEAKIIALSCMKPPEGYCRWSIRLLRDKVVELGYIDTIGRTTVNDVLKKRVKAAPK